MGLRVHSVYSVCAYDCVHQRYQTKIDVGFCPRSTTQTSEKIRTYNRSRPSRVIDLGANQKRIICNFLLT